MAMTIAVHRVTKNGVTEVVPEHEVTPGDGPLMSSAYPPCHCPVHVNTPCRPEDSHVPLRTGI
ncbi:hypothetical protein ACWGCW_15505 [Streptomyces sp. NPDC054933]